MVGVLPTLIYAVAQPLRDTNAKAGVLQAPPIPIDVDLGATARRQSNGVAVTWQPQGADVFYHVFRRPGSTPLLSCSGEAAQRCALDLTDLGATRSARFVDRAQPPADAVYYVGVAANWLDDTSQGDVYLLSRPATP